MVTPDYYATLGLSPASEDVVIRAAYVALVRRYHPDGNPSAAAAARTRAINAAYAVLGDPDRRAEYDGLREAEAWAEAPPRWRRAPPTGLFAAAAMLLLLMLLPMAIWSPTPMPARTGEPPAPRAASPASNAAAPEMAQAGNAFAVPDQGIAARPGPQPKPAPAHPPSLPASGRAAAPAIASATIRPADAPATAIASAIEAAAPAALEAKPSFSCSIARTRGEVAVCNSASLATLDRQQALLYSQSWSRADSAKRAQLLSSRERFLARRDACRSTACTSGAYLARMREVSEIMTGGERLR